MTDELTKTFFDTFGIEPKIRFHCANSQPCAHTGFHCKSCTYHSKDVIYPQITDRILLELICMANQHEDYPISTNIKNIQARTLRILLRTEKFYKNYYGSDGRYKKLVKQVRTLFEEG